MYVCVCVCVGRIHCAVVILAHLWRPQYTETGKLYFGNFAIDGDFCKRRILNKSNINALLQTKIIIIIITSAIQISIAATCYLRTQPMTLTISLLWLFLSASRIRHTPCLSSMSLPTLMTASDVRYDVTIVFAYERATATAADEQNKNQKCARYIVKRSVCLSVSSSKEIFEMWQKQA